MASKAATLGDPRRPQEVKKMSVVPIVPDETLSQTILFSAMGAAVTGLMLQNKAMVWVGLVMCLASYSHMPYDAPESKRMMMFVFTMVVWAITQVYFKPFLVAQRATGAPAASSPPAPSLMEEE